MTARRARPPVKIAASVALKYAVAMRRHARLSPGASIGTLWVIDVLDRMRPPTATHSARARPKRLGGHGNGWVAICPRKKHKTRPHASGPVEVALVAFERTLDTVAERAEIAFKVLRKL